MEDGEDFHLSHRRGVEVAVGGRADGVVTFKTLTMQRDTLHNKDMLCKGYQPKMLLYALDRLFFIFDQVKWQRGIDEMLIVA